MFNYEKNIVKHAKDMPAGTVCVTSTAPCEGEKTCVSSSSLCSFMYEKKKKQTVSFPIST